MTGLRHFLRTRRYTACCVAIVAVGIINLAIGTASFQTGSINPTSMPLSLILPVIAVVAIVAIGESTAPCVDQLASRPLRRYQTIIDVSLISIAIGTLVATTGPAVAEAFSSWTVARNIAGLAGLAWLASLITRQVIACAAPITLVLIATTLGRHDSAISATWTWLLDRTNTPSSWTIALALLIAGIASRWTETSHN